MHRLLLVVPPLAALLLASAAGGVENAASNWHQWRGPLANGVAPQGAPPLQWSADDGVNIRWKTPLPGSGSASPIVWGDRIFILTAVDTGQPAPAAASPADDAPAADDAAAEPAPADSPESAPPQAETSPVDGGPFDRERRGRRFGRRRDAGPQNIMQFTVLCLDRRTGDIVWQKVAREAAPHEGKHGDNTFASGSPTTDGKRLYATFGSQGIFCYDLDGRLLWERDLGDLTSSNSFGEGASPTIHQDTLIVPWDHESGSKLFALNAANGDVRWEQTRDEPTTWTTPLVVEAAGRTQVILNGTNRSRSYDFHTGDEIWQCGGQGSNPIPVPVVFENLVFCMTGHRNPAAVAIPLDSRGDVTESPSIPWRTTRGTPYVPSPLLMGDRLYFTKGNNGVLSSVDARSGEPVIDQERIPGLDNIYASMVAADGRIYVTGRDGTTVVLKHGDALEVLATNTVGEDVDATPAIVGDELFIRGKEHLFCICQ